jgi:hypothetical protein
VLAVTGRAAAVEAARAPPVDPAGEREQYGILKYR